jgi:hypothetical protein
MAGAAVVVLVVGGGTVLFSGWRWARVRPRQVEVVEKNGDGGELPELW